MKVDVTAAEPHNAWCFTASSWAVLGLAVLLVATFGLFVGIHVTSPSDGARFLWSPSAFRPNGVEVAPLKQGPESIHEGDVVVAVEGRSLESWIRDTSAPWAARGRWDIGQTVTYTVERDGSVIDLGVTFERYPLGPILARSWGIFLAALLFVF